MAVAEDRDLVAYCRDVAERARAASRQLEMLDGATKNAWLREGARLLRSREADLQEANQQDLEAAPGFGLTDAQIDRLRLTTRIINGMAQGMEEIAMQSEPIGEIIGSSIRPNGLLVEKVRVPLGVVFFIYESRPNVTVDAASICLKSGNAVILRGGKEAAHSNAAIAAVLAEASESCGVPRDAVQLVATADREAVGHFLKLHELINVAIPRGGESLIRRVSAEATMPVIKHYAGNCHVYVDEHANPQMALEITVNSKCQRLGVCNAAESLIVHEGIAESFLPRVGKSLQEAGIELRGDDATCRLVAGAVPATDEDYAQEYLGPTISVKVVASLEDAVKHIHQYGSGHTEAIVTDNLSAAREFARRVDSSAVMVNASTRFNDGGQFGLGAEIGISTDKFHARGPCGVGELTSYKYVVLGRGHIHQ